ncbi:MAG TPA: TIGR01777 family protein [Desulfobulbus sp.]|nr:TIGR01777 family protein [Desulfobulbus sp.]HHD63779.1 TIGR01777 family protein [Desulfobulbaceae bacterium]
MNNKKHRIAISGSTGFVGKRLSRVLIDKGWDVIPLVRQDFDTSSRDLAGKLDGADAVVNLAGAPIIKRWTAGYKKVLYDSRIKVTRKLVKACEEMAVRPDVFISTSAIGIYTDEGRHTEDSFVKADNFLADLAWQWEQEAMQAEKLGIRTVIFRLGVVLGRQGGALKQMLLPFKLGLGGRIGNGKQPFSWIHIEDLMQAYVAALSSASFDGVYNLTAPNPTTNNGLTRALGKALHRPTFFPVPRLALKLHFGEGASVLTGGQHVLPGRLLQEGFTFTFPTIDEAIKNCVAP